MEKVQGLGVILKKVIRAHGKTREGRILQREIIANYL